LTAVQALAQRSDFFRRILPHIGFKAQRVKGRAVVLSTAPISCKSAIASCTEAIASFLDFSVESPGKVKNIQGFPGSDLKVAHPGNSALPRSCEEKTVHSIDCRKPG
jgi:hypothetical protein